MKKTIMVLLVFALSFVAAFASSTATLNLTTTVAPVTNVAVVKANAVPTTFPTTGVIGAEKQNVTVSAVSYAFVVETNQALSAVSVQANPLKSGSSYIKYTVTAGSSTSTATNADGASVQLMAASANTTGKRVVGGVFTIAGASTTDGTTGVFGLNDAPAGAYEGSVTITYTAS